MSPEGHTSLNTQQQQFKSGGADFERCLLGVFESIYMRFFGAVSMICVASSWMGAYNLKAARCALMESSPHTVRRVAGGYTPSYQNLMPRNVPNIADLKEKRTGRQRGSAHTACHTPLAGHCKALLL